MISFSPVTAFGLVRRIAAAGGENPALYLLISVAANFPTVQADLAAELEVQLGVTLRELSQPQFGDPPPSGEPSPVTLITLAHDSLKLIPAMDRNVVLLTRGGAVLLLADHHTADRVLTLAPNLRNRLTDIIEIQPDAAFGGSPA